MTSSTFVVPQARRGSVAVDVGGVIVGGGAPVVVQSMTNTDTADIGCHRCPGRGAGIAPGRRSCALPSTGPRAAAAGAEASSERLERHGSSTVPLVGDFHYIGHKLLDRLIRTAPKRPRQVPYQPGQCRLQGQEATRQFIADHRHRHLKHDKPVRIGVNWGSLDQELLTRLMDENAGKRQRRSERRAP
jgi:(E)-4-hydroxy-3-methylbut-2-enyl-diphosphate synthase